MPKKTSSAIKAARVAERRRAINQAIIHRVRTGFRRFAVLAKTDASSAVAYGRQVVSWLDRAAKTHALHRNNANRHKSAILNRLSTIVVKKSA